MGLYLTLPAPSISENCIKTFWGTAKKFVKIKIEINFFSSSEIGTERINIQKSFERNNGNNVFYEYQQKHALTIYMFFDE